MDREVAKAKLKEKTTEVQTLKHDFEGSALCYTSSELEKANIEIDYRKILIDGLTKENAMLRRQLEGHALKMRMVWMLIWHLMMRMLRLLLLLLLLSLT